MKIKYLGQGGFAFQLKGKNIIVDPFIKDNPINPMESVKGIEAEYLLLTHGHGDHVADVEGIAAQNDVTIISNYEIVTYYGAKGINGHPLNHGGKYTFDFGTVKYVNAIHSSVLPDGTYGGNPGGFVIWNEDVCFYIAGDTALTLDMKLIPMTCPPLDFAILPIGDNFTMGYDDAAIAAEFIGCDRIIGCHYDTFGYIEIDHDKAVQAFSAKGKELILIDVEEMVEI
jgi:L-ascorbate metabolism protein UlaG (beta-lactamase superfamily)